MRLAAARRAGAEAAVSRGGILFDERELEAFADDAHLRLELEREPGGDFDLSGSAELDLEPGDNPPAVQEAIVPARAVEEVRLIALEVLGGQDLAREVPSASLGPAAQGSIAPDRTRRRTTSCSTTV
jgi:hypothetical protein